MIIIDYSVLVLAVLLGLFLAAVIARAIIEKQSIIGRPPIPVFFFVLAKLCVIVNLVFLVLSGSGQRPYQLFEPGLLLAVPALLLLSIGLVILVVSSFKLNKALIFGIPEGNQQTLQTKGIYAISRHPFYLGFILILFSSCLLSPNIINIICFAAAWTIHHFIMIKEEAFLERSFGEEYRKYKAEVGRYITFKSLVP